MLGGVRDWIYIENAMSFLDLCSSRIGYHFDELDAGAVRHGLAATDYENDHWFDYPLVGDREVLIRLAQDPGSSVVFIDLSDRDLADFAAPLIVAMQHYWLSSARAPYADRWVP